MLRSYELSLPKILRVMRLSELKTGEKGVIVKVLGHGGFRKRIVEMGFIKGKTVEVLLNAPLKDPIKYKVLGYEISLRRQEAEMIEVISDGLCFSSYRYSRILLYMVLFLRSTR